jgi:hypothetical protein
VKPPLDPLWMVLVLDKANKKIEIAAFDPSREKAEASARELEAPDVPMISLNILGNPDAFRNRLSLWLAENEIVGKDNTDTMREIAKCMKEMMKSFDKPGKLKNRPLR